MNALYLRGLKIKSGLFFSLLFISELALSQVHKGRVFSSLTNSPLAYANVGIAGRNIGTVTDLSGSYTLDLESVNDTDSIRFSMIGYQSKTFLLRQFRSDSVKTVFLDQRLYTLTEVKITYHKLKEIRLGNPVISGNLKSGFANNTLGAELGIKLNVKKQVRLTDLDLNVATCTYDSVTYRLNIYESGNKVEYKNILSTPIYISFTKEMIRDVVTFDLRKYSLLIKGDVLISLELFKNLGDGRLLFNTAWFTGTTYHRQTIESKWIEAPGIIGMYLHGLVIK